MSARLTHGLDVAEFARIRTHPGDLRILANSATYQPDSLQPKGAESYGQEANRHVQQRGQEVVRRPRRERRVHRYPKLPAGEKPGYEAQEQSREGSGRQEKEDGEKEKEGRQKNEEGQEEKEIGQ